MKKAFYIIFVLLIIILFIIFDFRKNNANSLETEEYIKITFLDVGQGDASFIELPDKTQILVDCGKDAEVLEKLGKVMKYYDKEIDYLFVTHPDLDHYGGCIDVLKRFTVKNIVYTGLQKEDKTWQYFWELVAFEDAEYFEINSSISWDIASTTIDFLYHDIEGSDDNNSSLVFKMSFGENDILFVGDAEEKTEESLVDLYGDKLDADVLKVGHHGSNSSSGQDFLDIVTPEISIISAGVGNPYGHPSLRALKRLERIGSEIFRTDIDKSVILNIFEDKIEKIDF
jgi:competence protein ComEC